MKFIIDYKLFQKTLNSVYKVAYEASGLANKSFFITVKKDRVIFFVKNNVIAIEKTLVNNEKKLKIISSGKVIINAFVLNELVQKSQEEITFEVLEKTLIIIKTKNYNTKINAIDLNFWQENDYEKITQEKFSFPGEKIQELVNQVSYATDNNKDGRQIFKGINLKSRNQKLVAVATDGTRIVEKTLFPFSSELNLILPLFALAELNRINNLEKNLPVALFLGNNKNKTAKIEFVAFTLGDDIKLYSQLIEGKFPDTDKQFPVTWAEFTNIVCANQVLVSAIEKASIIFEKNSLPTVVFKIIKEKLYISSLEKSEIGFFEEEITITEQTNSKEQKINLQAKLLLTSLKTFPQAKTRIIISDDNNPVLFFSETDPSLKVLILPLWLY